MSAGKKIKNFLSNFWYYHKWKVIVIFFFVVVIGVCMTQMFTKDEYDVSVMYAGPDYIEENDHHSITGAFELILPSDYDNNGEKKANLIDMLIMSDEQIKERDDKAKEEDVAFYYDIKGRNSQLMQISTYISSGETIICILDDYVYEKLKEEGAFCTLESVLGYKPEGAYDEYSLTFGETEFYKCYSALSNIGENTRLCIVKMPYTFTTKQQKIAYEAHLDYFKEIVEFEVG